ncbi:EAL domain-containing protein [Rhodobacteraceae bacterium NNCM2]|nr:EAL domain-containing protein [Coraliihabitans acroporae]
MNGLKSLSITTKIAALSILACVLVLSVGLVSWLSLHQESVSLQSALSGAVRSGQNPAVLLSEFERIGDRARASFLQLFWLLSLGSIALSAAIFLISRRISAEIRRTADEMTRLAHGDFAIDIPTLDRADELGAMNASFRHFAETMREVTEARDRMRALSISDPLTQLLNRRGMDEYIEGLLCVEQPIACLTVMHIDLDHFKAVNDTFGHDAGDHVLMVASRRMKQAVREDDIVARVGGDEFVVLLPGLDDLGRLAQIASRLISSLNQPIDHEGRICQIGASVGIAIGGAIHDATDPERLLKDADLAVFRSKANGRGRFSVFDHRMRALMEHQQMIAERLRGAIDSGQIEAWLQPVFDIHGRRVLAFEALARWRDPRVGIVPAEDFIEVARQRNMLGEIGMAVLEKASSSFAMGQWARQWCGQLSVNLSAAEMNDPQIVDHLRWTIDKGCLAPERIGVEIPCSLVHDRGAERVAEVIGRLRALGVSVIIDGVEPGTLSLVDFSRLDASAAKLSGSFIERGMTDPQSQIEMTQTVAQLKMIGLNVYAKAISSVEMAVAARAAGVDGLQGYALSEPLDLKTCEERFLGDPGPMKLGAAG